MRLFFTLAFFLILLPACDSYTFQNNTNETVVVGSIEVPADGCVELQDFFGVFGDFPFKLTSLDGNELSEEEYEAGYYLFSVEGLSEVEIETACLVPEEDDEDSDEDNDEDNDEDSDEDSDEEDRDQQESTSSYEEDSKARTSQTALKQLGKQREEQRQEQERKEQEQQKRQEEIEALKVEKAQAEEAEKVAKAAVDEKQTSGKSDEEIEKDKEELKQVQTKLEVATKRLEELEKEKADSSGSWWDDVVDWFKETVGDGQTVAGELVSDNNDEADYENNAP